MSDTNSLNIPILSKYLDSSSSEFRDALFGAVDEAFLLDAQIGTQKPNVRRQVDVDSSSVYPHYEVTNETFCIKDAGISEEPSYSEDFDMIVQCPPVNRYAIQMRVRSISKGKPVILQLDA